MSRRKHLAAVWRDAIGDSELDSTAKLVALELSTFLNAQGTCYPSRGTLARRCSLSIRAVDRALRRLEVAGWLLVERTTGGNPDTARNRYLVQLPTAANEVRRSEWGAAYLTTVSGVPQSLSGVPGTPIKQLKAAESAAPIAAAALSGSAASGPNEVFAPEDDCHGCGKRATLAAPDFHYCGECADAIEAIRAEAAK